MYIGLIATRYATALVEYSSSLGEERQTYDEVQRLIAYYRADFSLRTFFFSPVLPADEKIHFFERLLDHQMSRSLEKFVRLVLRHHREHYLYFMFNSFVSLCKERHHVRDAMLITASPVKEEIVARFRQIARANTASEVNLRSEVRPELLGGFIFQVDDFRIDASLLRQYHLLKQKLCGKPNRIV